MAILPPLEDPPRRGAVCCPHLERERDQPQQNEFTAELLKHILLFVCLTWLAYLLRIVKTPDSASDCVSFLKQKSTAV